MTVRDYTRRIIVNSTNKVEVIRTLHGVRVYLLIENVSGGDVFGAPDTAPTNNDGITIPAGSRYERWEPMCPQNDYFIKGTTAADQEIQITEGYKDGN